MSTPGSPTDPPAPYSNSLGDRYPAAAAELAAHLPKRVVHGSNQGARRTVAVIRVNGRILPPIESGGPASDPLVAAADQLLLRLGFTPRQAAFLRYHAEIKAAALMLSFPTIANVEIAINNTPCGTEEFREFATVCTRALQKIFPDAGQKSLTVYGTYQDNRPYQHCYGRRRP